MPFVFAILVGIGPITRCRWTENSQKYGIKWQKGGGIYENVHNKAMFEYFIFLGFR